MPRIRNYVVKTGACQNSPSAINYDYNTCISMYIYAYVYIRLYLRGRQSAIVAGNYIHMHREFVKNNAVEIKIIYDEAEESVFALQMSLERFLGFHMIVIRRVLSKIILSRKSVQYRDHHKEFEFSFINFKL